MIYLDNAATTRPCAEAVAAVNDALTGYLSVPGLKRSVLFPSFSGEQYPFPDSGNGIQYICGNSRSL